MDYRKLDAPLISALRDVESLGDVAGTASFPVFIHTESIPSPDQTEVLRKAGVHDPDARQQVFTAHLTVHGVAELSDQPWVRALRLSGASRMLPAAGGS